jgi:hypothetical protein
MEKVVARTDGGGAFWCSQDSAMEKNKQMSTNKLRQT